MEGSRLKREMASILNEGRWSYLWFFASIQLQSKGRTENEGREGELRFLLQPFTIMRTREYIAPLFIFAKNMETGVR